VIPCCCPGADMGLKTVAEAAAVQVDGIAMIHGD
jgi:hypothetical protein